MIRFCGTPPFRTVRFARMAGACAKSLGAPLGLAVIGLALSTPAAAAVIEVPADQPTIQAGVDVATAGDEVVVAPGLYEEIVDLQGKTITVRSSGGAAVTTIDATNVLDPGTGKPVFQAVSGEVGTTIEGFTITGGTGEGASIGGGLYAFGANLIVRDCVFTDLAATGGGGAIFADSSELLLERCSFLKNTGNRRGGAVFVYGGSLTAVDCWFEGNSAPHQAGRGGAIRAEGPGDLILNRCDFLGNSAGVPDAGLIPPSASGGAIYSDGVDLIATNCRFLGNTAINHGGALAFYNGTASVTGCSFGGNVAANPGGARAGDGGAVHTFSGGVTFELANSTFSGNYAMFRWGGAYLENARVINSVFWENSDSNGMVVSSQLFGTPLPTVDHSIVMGGYAGTANLDADPLFVDADGADNVVGTDDDDLRLSAGSPAIDSGDTISVVGLLGNEDLDGNPRVADDDATVDTGIAVFGLAVIDRGPYEVVAADPTAQCEADLAQCTADQTQCDADLTQCSADGAQCDADLTQCSTDGAQCDADLTQCSADGAQCDSDLTQCSADEAQCGIDRDECGSALDSCLVAPVPDADADGEPDASDACASTPAAELVDSAGCSQAEFCSGFDVSASEGRTACRRADWGNDEPARRRSRDCRLQRDSTGEVNCVVRED